PGWLGTAISIRCAPSRRGESRHLARHSRAAHVHGGEPASWWAPVQLLLGPPTADQPAGAPGHRVEPGLVAILAEREVRDHMPGVEIELRNQPVPERLHGIASADVVRGQAHG